MKIKILRRALCAGLAAALLIPAAVAENPSDNVAGFNPFDPDSAVASLVPGEPTPTPVTGPFGVDTDVNATAEDLFGNTVTSELGDDPFGTGGATSATTVNDPFGTGSATNTTTVNDPFGVGSATNTTTVNDPFGTGSAANTTTNDPFGTGTADTGTAGIGTAYDPFAVGTATAQPANDPFGTGGAALQPTANPFDLGTATAQPASDPFGVTMQPVVTSTPVPAGGTVSGYNPYDTSESAQAIPVNATMYVTDSVLKLRARPKENSKLVANVYFGQALNVVATQAEWAQVQNANGNTCYCLYRGLSATDPNTMSKPMYAQLGTTPMYRAPSQKQGRVRNLKKGDTVTMTAITADGLWSRVTDGNNYGFIPTIYLDDTPAAQGTPVWCVAGSTPVMVNPEGWIQITVLSFAQPCYLVGYTGADNAIAKIRSAKGYVAYCAASALTTVDPATLSTPVYAQVTGKLLCTTTGDNAKVLNVNKNVHLILLGIDNDGRWALVKQGKRKLYIPYVYVGPTAMGRGYRVVVTNQEIPLYNSTDPNSGVLGTLPLGTRLNLVGGDLTYAQVATISDGITQPTTGYVPLQYLRGE